MKINFSFKSYIEKAKNNIVFILWPVLGVILIVALWVAHQSIGIISSSREVTTLPATKQVRVNFGLYDEIVKRQDDVAGFIPTPVTTQTPFGQAMASAGQ